MVTTFTYTEFGEDRCTQFRVIVLTDSQTNKHSHKPIHRQDPLQYTAPLSLACSVISRIIAQYQQKFKWLLDFHRTVQTLSKQQSPSVHSRLTMSSDRFVKKTLGGSPTGKTVEAPQALTCNTNTGVRIDPPGAQIDGDSGGQKNHWEGWTPQPPGKSDPDNEYILNVSLFLSIYLILPTALMSQSRNNYLQTKTNINITITLN